MKFLLLICNGVLAGKSGLDVVVVQVCLMIRTWLQLTSPLVVGVFCGHVPLIRLVCRAFGVFS
jgi:hypothetical protein